MTQETVELIRQLADKLGTTAEHLWAVLIVQAPIYSISILIAIMIALVSLAAVICICIKKREEADYDIAWVLDLIILLGIGLFLGVGTAAVINAPLILAGFLNPEYWALKQLIK